MDAFRAALTSFVISYLALSLGRSFSVLVWDLPSPKVRPYFCLSSLQTRIPFQPVAVEDSFAVVVHAIEDEVAMGIGGVVVSYYDISTCSILEHIPFHDFRVKFSKSQS